MRSYTWWRLCSGSSRPAGVNPGLYGRRRAIFFTGTRKRDPRLEISGDDVAPAELFSAHPQEVQRRFLFLGFHISIPVKSKSWGCFPYWKASLGGRKESCARKAARLLSGRAFSSWQIMEIEQSEEYLMEAAERRGKHCADAAGDHLEGLWLLELSRFLC